MRQPGTTSWTSKTSSSFRITTFVGERRISTVRPLGFATTTASAPASSQSAIFSFDVRKEVVWRNDFNGEVGRAREESVANLAIYGVRPFGANEGGVRRANVVGREFETRIRSIHPAQSVSPRVDSSKEDPMASARFRVNVIG